MPTPDNTVKHLYKNRLATLERYRKKKTMRNRYAPNKATPAVRNYTRTL